MARGVGARARVAHARRARRVERGARTHPRLRAAARGRRRRAHVLPPRPARAPGQEAPLRVQRVLRRDGLRRGRGADRRRGARGRGRAAFPHRAPRDDGAGRHRAEDDRAARGEAARASDDLARRRAGRPARDRRRVRRGGRARLDRRDRARLRAARSRGGARGRRARWLGDRPHGDAAAEPGPCDRGRVVPLRRGGGVRRRHAARDARRGRDADARVELAPRPRCAARRPPQLHRPPRKAARELRARHEVLVAALRGDPRGALRRAHHGRRAARRDRRRVRGVGAGALRRRAPRRVVRLPPPRRHGRVEPEGQPLEGALPSAADAAGSR